MRSLFGIRAGVAPRWRTRASGVISTRYPRPAPASTGRGRLCAPRAARRTARRAATPAAISSMAHERHAQHLEHAIELALVDLARLQGRVRVPEPVCGTAQHRGAGGDRPSRPPWHPRSPPDRHPAMAVASTRRVTPSGSRAVSSSQEKDMVGRRPRPVRPARQPPRLPSHASRVRAMTRPSPSACTSSSAEPSVEPLSTAMTARRGYV